MQYEDRQTFDQPAATVIRMFGDRAYFERKYAEIGFANVTVLEHDSKGDAFRIKIRYDAKNDVQLPDFAKKFMPPIVTVTQQDSWDLAKRRGRLEFELKGVPVKIFAEMQLSDQGKGAVNVIRWTISSGVPLIGGKLEKLLLSDIQAKAGADLAASRKILVDYMKG